MFGYKKLIVWQKAMDLTEKVYALIRSLPADEKYALAGQLRRSVISISSNIAEGAGRATNKDYAHFLTIARGSLYEVLSQLDAAERLGYLSVGKDIEDLANEIARMLGSMLKKMWNHPLFDFDFGLRLKLLPEIILTFVHDVL